MRLTLLESNRRFFQTAECAFLSIVAHAGVIWGAVAVTAGGRLLPTDEREARVFFLLPPDRVGLRSSQMQQIQWADVGGDVDNGRIPKTDGEGLLVRRTPAAQRGAEPKSGARGKLPFGPDVRLMDTVFSMLEVDSAVQRYEWSAAPVYPPELLASGTEGVVYAQFIVDTTGMVDTTSIRLLTSAHPAFSASVRSALSHMQFRPATRGLHKVRQLVEQHFRFTIAPPERQLSVGPHT
ncbi:MAG TPA: TonB family protein [Gemmatimonadales bacterium]|jgi:TonB family protein|nr:TonB family protein [Gemmatimonadales bacterium]